MLQSRYQPLREWFSRWCYQLRSAKLKKKKKKRECAKVSGNANHSVCKFRRCHGENKGGREARGEKKKHGATQQDDICVGAAPCLFVFSQSKAARPACARTLVAAVTSRGQRRSRQFILSSSRLQSHRCFKQIFLLPPPEKKKNVSCCRNRVLF